MFHNAACIEMRFLAVLRVWKSLQNDGDKSVRECRVEWTFSSGAWCSFSG